MKLSDIRTIRVAKLGDTKFRQFPMQYKITNTVQNSIDDAPISPDSQRSPICTDGGALALKDPRKAQFFGMRLTK